MEILEVILKYASLLLMVGAVISFVVGFVKWFDQRNREQEQQQHEVFFKMICLASGKNEAGQIISMNQQIAAIYQLQNYPKYAFSAVPVLKLMQFDGEKMKTDARYPFMHTAIGSSLNALARHVQEKQERNQ